MSSLSLPNLRGALASAAIAGFVLIFALVFAAAIASQPVLAVIVPAVLVTGLLCARFPAAAVWVALFFTGTFGSVQAFTGFAPGVVVDLLVAGLWAGVLLSLAVGKRDRPWWIWPGMAITLLYVVVTFFETFTAISLSLGLQSFKDTGWPMLTLALLGFAGWRLETYTRIAKAIIGVAFLVAAYAVYRHFAGPSQSERELAFAAATTYNSINGELSLIGSFTTRHELAFWTALVIPVCLAAALTGFPARWRLLAAATVVLSFAAAFDTDVRAALPAIIAGCGLVIILNVMAGRGRGSALAQALTGLVLVVTVGTALFVFVVGDKTDRYGALIKPSGDVSYEGRITKWKAALEDIDNHPFGLGLASAGKLAERGDNPFVTTGTYNVDSSYLKIAFEQGFPVLALFAIGMLALLVGLARRAVRVRDGPVRALAIGASGTLVAGLIMFVTGEYIESPVVFAMWIPIGAAIGGLAAVRQQEADERDQKAHEREQEQAPSPPAERLPARVAATR